MAFRRKQAAPEPQVPEIVRVGRQMAARDGLAFNVAQEAVSDWMKEFPGVAEVAGRSDQGATRPTRMMAQEQAGAMTKQWVVGFMQIRCTAIGYMLGAPNQEKSTREFGDLFREFMDASGLPSEKVRPR